MLLINPHNPWFLGYWAVLALTGAGSISAWVWASNQVSSNGRSVVRTLLEIPPHRLVPWGAGTIGAVVLVYLGIQSGSYIGLLEFRARGLVPGPALGADEPLRASDQLVLMTCINILTLVLIPSLLFLFCGARPRDYGFVNRRQMVQDARFGFLAFLLATPVIYLAFFLAQLLWSPENHFIFESLKHGLSLPLALLAIISAVVTAPASEELFFRGLLLGWLVRASSQPQSPRLSLADDQNLFSQSDRSRQVSAWVANVLSSLVFAALHAAQWPAPVPLFVLSLVLGWLYLRSGRLVAPWTLHTAFNALSTICMLLQVQAGALPRDAVAPRPAAFSGKIGHLTGAFHNLRSHQQANSRVDLPAHQGSGTGDAIPGRPHNIMGRTMDEKGATYLCDLIKSGSADPGAESPSARYLIILRGGVPGSMLPLAPGLRSLGRSSESDLQIPEMSVSRQHASIEIDNEGKVWLVDLNSSNGTFRNGERLVPRVRHLLSDGDRIGFGPSLLVKFTCPDPTEERCQRELFERAFRDPLTGLFNRGYFLDQAAHLERQAASLGLGLAVLMLDIDHFKEVNDTFGHDAGDGVLREVAQVIRSATRADDLVARYGGEEFVVALPIGTPDHATERAERIRETVASRRIALMGHLIRVTSSIGVAFAAPGRHRPLTSLISAADAGLYQAKRGGRDRVVFRGERTENGEGSNTTIDYIAAL